MMSNITQIILDILKYVNLIEWDERNRLVVRVISYHLPSSCKTLKPIVNIFINNTVELFKYMFFSPEKNKQLNSGYIKQNQEIGDVDSYYIVL